MTRFSPRSNYLIKDMLEQDQPAGLLLEHILDQINLTAGRIEFIAEQNVSRTGRRTKSAVHAGAQDLLGGCELRVL